MLDALLMLLWVALWLFFAKTGVSALTRWRDKDEEARRVAWHKRLDAIKADIAKQQEMLDRMR